MGRRRVGSKSAREPGGTRARGQLGPAAPYGDQKTTALILYGLRVTRGLVYRMDQPRESFADDPARPVSDANRYFWNLARVANLKLIGLLRWEIRPVDPADPLGRESVDMALELHRLKDLIDDPGTHLRQTLRWGESDFDPSSFFRIYARLFHPEESIRFAVIDGDPAIRHGSLIVRRQSALVPPGIEPWTSIASCCVSEAGFRWTTLVRPCAVSEDRLVVLKVAIAGPLFCDKRTLVSLR